VSFDFSGYVLRGVRISPTNAVVSAEPSNGVVRDIRAVPGAYALSGEAPDLVEAAADQYRASILNNAVESTTEYLLWAANSAQLAVVDDPTWLLSEGSGRIPLGTLTVTDLTPDNLPAGEPPPKKYGTFPDGSARVVVTDNGLRSIANIAAVVVARGDVDDYDDDGWVDPDDVGLGRLGSNPYYVIESAAIDQDADAGIVRLTDAQLTTLDGGLSNQRGDEVIEVRYTLSAARFWWSRNDRHKTRFGWDGRTQKWAPLKGGAPKDLGALDFESTHRVTPVPTGLPVGTTLPGSEADPDSFAMIRLGTSPGASSFPVAADGAFTGIKVKFDSDLEGGFDFTKDPLIAGVLGRTNGILQFNPNFIATQAGQTVWYSYLSFEEDSDGRVGLLLDAKEEPLFIAPIPGPTDHPFIHIGSRRHLTVQLADTDAELAGATIQEGEVGVSLSTGQLKFSSVDLDKADPSTTGFSPQYLGTGVNYAGVALNRVPQPTRKAVQLVDDTGTPVDVTVDNDLYVPDLVYLPEEFALDDPVRGLGISGVLDVPDGTGSIPILPGTPAPVRPGGESDTDPQRGRIRQVEDGVSDTILFARPKVIETLNIVDREVDLPTLPFKVPQGTAYIAKERGPGGSRVVFSSKDRGEFVGGPAFFLQANLTPSTYTTRARLLSRVRDIFIFEGGEKLRFHIDGTSYTWEADTLLTAIPGRNAYLVEEVADSIDDAITGTGSARVFNGHIALEAGDLDTGEVEIGFATTAGEKDLTGASALGFPPGWRAVGGVVNWLPDAGMSWGLYRSPANLNGEFELSDYNSRARIEELPLGTVQGVPFVFLNPVPLQDVAGLDEDIFFQLTNVIQEGETIEIVNQVLRHFQDIKHEFDIGRFAWLEDGLITQTVERPVLSLGLGNQGVVAESLLGAPGIGGGLAIAETGGSFELQTFGDDFLLPDDGAQGVALLVDRVGRRHTLGARGFFSEGSDEFTDATADFSEAEPGYRLKITRGDAAGSYVLTEVVSATELRVSPAFVADAADNPVTWELFEGFTTDVFDPAIVADITFDLFNHLPNEPFVIRTLTPLGTVDEALVADPGDALENGRFIQVRFGLEAPTDDNTASVSVLGKTELATIANDLIVIPTDEPRFSEAAFTIRLGPATLVPVGVTSFSADPAGVEYLLADGVDGEKGLLKFGSAILSGFANTKVYFAEEFLPSSVLAAGATELNPDTGDLSLSDADVATHAGKTAYFVQRMITENRLDVAASPIVGTFYFNHPIQVDQSVEVEYFEADLEGKKVGDQIVEFLSVFITKETAERESATSYLFNASLKTVDTRIETLVYVGIFQQNFGSQDFEIEYLPDGRGRISFSKSLADSAAVTVSYAVFEANGGERVYESSTKPVYRPPFFIKAGLDQFGVRGDRQDEFQVGQMLRIGESCFYIRKITYFTDEDITALGIFPSTSGEEGSRAPANDILSLITTTPITSTVDPDGALPVDVPEAPAGFMQTVPIADAPFEPVVRGQTSITFLADLTGVAVPGHILEVGGRPFTIADLALSEDGTRTKVSLTAPFKEGINVNTDPTVKVSIRPVYPPGTRTFLGVGPVVASEPLELVRYTDGQPGRTLIRGVEYDLEPDTGIVTLLDPGAEPLAAGEQLYLAYTKLRTLEPFVQQGILTFPRYTATYLYNTIPSDDNGLLGGLLTTTYTFSTPDAFYFRTVPLRSFLGEVVERAQQDLQASNPAAGPLTTAVPATDNWDQGRLAIQSERRNLVDFDRAARVFVDFYNQVINGFEQMLETMSGGLIGDRDGKFRFEVGRGLEYPPPGYEDAITGELNPRNVFADVFTSKNTRIDVFLTTDPIVRPPGARLIGGEIDGVFPGSPEIADLIEEQSAFVRNDVDDLVMTSLKALKGKIDPDTLTRGLIASGLYQRLAEPSFLSRLFPLIARVFFQTYPGIGADLLGGDPGRYSYQTSDPITGQTVSTYNTVIAKLGNPVLGELDNVIEGSLEKRFPRARIWKYEPLGFPEMDDLLTAAGLPTFSATPRPAVIATPLLLRDFPIDPERGGPDVDQLVSQGGLFSDLELGDVTFVMPPWEPGQQIAWGVPTGEIHAAFHLESDDTLTGVFIDEVLLGCILTFRTEDPAASPDPGFPITDGDRLLVDIGNELANPSAEDFPLEQGATIFGVPTIDAKVTPSDPPTKDDLVAATKGIQNFRTGFDLSIKGDGTVVDLSWPAEEDPAYPVQELRGQNPPDPLESLQGVAQFLRGDLSPLRIPALTGDERDDSGDQQIPFLATQNTELDRFGEAAVGLAKPMEVTDDLGNYVYPDEFIGNDGEIRGDFVANGATYKEPAALNTSLDVHPVANSGLSPGVGDLESYDLLLVEVDDAEDRIVVGSQGLLSVGRAETSLVSGSDYQSVIEPPRFVTQSNAGTPIRYRFNNAIVFTTPGAAYPPDPQVGPTPAGVRIIEDTVTGVTALEFDDLSGSLALNDGVTAGGGVGNLNHLWSAVGAKFYNKITIELFARTDPNITTALAPGALPTPGLPVLTIVIQGTTVTATEHQGNPLPPPGPVTSVVFGTDSPFTPLPVDNNQIRITHGPGSWLFAGAVPPETDWFLPHTVGVTNDSIYGYEFSISIDTYNFDVPVLPGPSFKGESTTAYIDPDRLTFHELFDMRHIKARGYTHPLSAHVLEGQLSVFEVTVADPSGAGGFESNVNRFTNGFSGLHPDGSPDPDPYTFLTRSITASDPGSYLANSPAGGTWAPEPTGGTIRVMGWEGYLNTPVLTGGAAVPDAVKFTAIPSSLRGPDATDPICTGRGLTESIDNTSVTAAVAALGSTDADNRLLDISIIDGAISDIEKGDILIIRESDDAGFAATTKAGTYLVRLPVEPDALGGLWRTTSGLTAADQIGAWDGWIPSPGYPRLLSLTLGGPGAFEVTDLAGFPLAPTVGAPATPSGFPASGRVYVVRDVLDLHSTDLEEFRTAVVSVAYTSIDTSGANPVFTGLSDYKDATDSVISALEFEDLVVGPSAPSNGYQVAGMHYFPIAIPPTTVTGFEADIGAGVVPPLGMRWVTLSGQGDSEVFEGDGGAGSGKIVNSGSPGAGEMGVIEDPPLPSTDFQAEDATVFSGVPGRLDTSALTDAQWDLINNPSTSPSPGTSDLRAMLPRGYFFLTNSKSGHPMEGELGFYAQAGIFLEPSFPRPVLDLDPSAAPLNHPRVVDSDHSLLASIEIGMRNMETLLGIDLDGAGANTVTAPTDPERVNFEVRRIRRFHDVQEIVGQQIEPLRYAYEIRRGRITGYDASARTLEAVGFSMTYNADVPSAPLAADVWNDGQTYTGTNLGDFSDEDVNVKPGDLVRVLDENGDVVDQATILRYELSLFGPPDPGLIQLAPPGLIALPPGDYTADGGMRFEVYLRQPVVPLEQSHEQLLGLMTDRVVHQTRADYTALEGGYVPSIAAPAEYPDNVNKLHDDLNASGATAAETFAGLGVREGDIVIVDPAPTLPQSGGLPVVPEKGARPRGDAGISDRPASHITGEPNPLDDNRGWYRVLSVETDPLPHLVVSGSTSLTGDLTIDVVFPEAVSERATRGYTVYPTVGASTLSGGNEGQMDLRPTDVPDGATNSYQVGSTREHSIRPFSYKVIRPSSLFEDETVDLLLSSRERLLSMLEQLKGLLLGTKRGTYFVFQRDNHAHDVGSPTDESVGLGVLSNAVIEGLVGRVNYSPFVSDSDGTSLLDRRFWILDNRLDTLSPTDPDPGLASTISSKVAGVGDTPYTAYNDLAGSLVRPVLPDRIDIVLDIVDRFRQLRFTWLTYRTHRVLGTLAGIERFDAEIEARLEAQRQQLLQNESAGDV